MDVVLILFVFAGGLVLGAFVIAIYEQLRDARPLPQKGKKYDPNLSKLFMKPEVQQALDNSVQPKPRRGRPRKATPNQKGNN